MEGGGELTRVGWLLQKDLRPHSEKRTGLVRERRDEGVRLRAGCGAKAAGSLGGELFFVFFMSVLDK